MSVAQRLAELGIILPTPAKAVANYVPLVVAGDFAIVSGQLPLEHGQMAVTGKLGQEVDVEAGVRAARACFINILAQLDAHLVEGLASVARVVRLGGFIAATPFFTEHAKVMNGASDLAVAVFGDAGRHARSTIGVASLPLDAAVEIEGMFLLH
ncbi:MAG: RidA family protein [Acidiphilium sp.]|nr:RidA family protein [Acidiphilium sp.]MDD4936490.1 RidA family protein [Acidiphilium sp.]